MLTEAQVSIALELYGNRDFDMTIDQIGELIGIDSLVVSRLVNIYD